MPVLSSVVVEREPLRSRRWLVVPIRLSVRPGGHDLPGGHRDMAIHPAIIASLPMSDVFEFRRLQSDRRRVEIPKFPPTDAGTGIKAVPIQAGLHRLGHNGKLLPVIRRIAQIRIVVTIAAIAL